MALFLTIVALIGGLTLGGKAPLQTSDIQVVDPTVSYHFGEDIDFQARIIPSDSTCTADIFFQPAGDEVHVGTAEVDNQGIASYHFSLQTGAIRPFARITYWLRFRTADGYEYTSPMFWFDYVDNRFDWQDLADGPIRVHWIRGDVSFGQAVLNTAQKGLDEIQRIVPLTPNQPIDFYVYPDISDLQAALQLGGQDWVAGSASPDLGVVLISIQAGPDQRLELERQVPHELAHTLLYQATGSGYSNIPVWLSEGIASLAELYPNPDYQRSLDVARDSGGLLSIASLCTSFPKDASGAFLAYAEATSFTRYLQKNYGTSGIQAMIRKYVDGLGCSEGVDAALGVSLAQLEFRWQNDSLKAQPGRAAWMRLLPYLALFLLVITLPMIPVLISLSKRKAVVKP